MANLKPCPFCGLIPKLPDGRGTQYEIACICGQAYSSVQISDYMSITERQQSALEFPEYRYHQRYIDRASQKAVEAWNKRWQEDG